MTQTRMILSHDFGDIKVRKLTQFGWVLFWSALFLSFQATAAWKPEVVESNTPEAILARIKPVGDLTVEGEVAKPQAVAKVLSADAGKKRYESTCHVCHGAGIAGAPKFRNNADWKERAAAGMDEMLKIAIQGKGGMPPKGTCMDCTDDELKLTIQYMIPQ